MGSFGSNSSKSTQEGFGGLPPEIQNAFKGLATGVSGFLPQNNPNSASMFTPLAQTEGETQALSAINRGFAPDAAQLQSDINMQTNPFDNSVINTINREAQGQGSVLNSQLSKVGQFGSNRAALGANDIDITRQNQIGSFKQNQYNTALNNALTTLPSLRNQDATAQFQGGQFQRDLSGQTQQAPLNALGQISKILGVLPQNSGQGTSKSSGFSLGIGGSLFPGGK